MPKLRLFEMDDESYRKNRAELRAYLDRSAALRAEPVMTKRGKNA
jgi:hypothetical protein